MDRERLTNTGDQGRLVNDLPERRRHVVRKQHPIEMETCTVCGGSFKKGRGLKVHKSKSRCGALELSRKASKSRKGSPPDKHHSGSTKETFIPRSMTSPKRTSKEEESVERSTITQCLDGHSPRNSKEHHGKKVQQTLDSILIVDDEVELSIKESVL